MAKWTMVRDLGDRLAIYKDGELFWESRQDYLASLIGKILHDLGESWEVIDGVKAEDILWKVSGDAPKFDPPAKLE